MDWLLPLRGTAEYARRLLPALLLVILIGIQTAARTGDFSGYVASTKPTQNWRLLGYLPLEGYVRYWGSVPVHGDAESFLALTRFMQGQLDPEGTGIYDRRAGYAWLGALISPLCGYYRSFVALNALAWLGAALAMYWLAGRFLGSRLGAWLAGVLTATGYGFSFAVGTPVSTLFGFAGVSILVAFIEWSGLLRPPFRWRDWLHTGWLITVVSFFYPAHFALMAYVWLCGLRTVPLTRLLVMTGLVLVLTQAWPLFGSEVIGLQFKTENSRLAADALRGWQRLLSLGPTHDFTNWLRTIPTAGVVYGAFPGVVLLAAVVSYPMVSAYARHRIVALCLVTLLAATIFSIKFALPRTAFFAYPAIYLLAAAGLHRIGRGPAGWRRCGILSVAIVTFCLLVLVAPSLAVLVGYGNFDNSFHYWNWDPVQ